MGIGSSVSSRPGHPYRQCRQTGKRGSKSDRVGGGGSSEGGFSTSDGLHIRMAVMHKAGNESGDGDGDDGETETKLRLGTDWWVGRCFSQTGLPDRQTAPATRPRPKPSWTLR